MPRERTPKVSTSARSTSRSKSSAKESTSKTLVRGWKVIREAGTSHIIGYAKYHAHFKLYVCKVNPRKTSSRWKGEVTFPTANLLAGIPEYSPTTPRSFYHFEDAMFAALKAARDMLWQFMRQLSDLESEVFPELMKRDSINYRDRCPTGIRGNPLHCKHQRKKET